MRCRWPKNAPAGHSGDRRRRDQPKTERAAKQGAPDAYNAIGELYLGHAARVGPSLKGIKIQICP